MHKPISLEKQKFAFSNAWVAFKVDDEDDLQKIKIVESSKDTDIVGIYQNRLYFIEATNLRGYRIQNKKKLKNGEMAQEFAQKVHGSIAAIVGAFHATEHKDQWVSFMGRLADRENKIHVILWMEQDRPFKKSDMKIIMGSLKKHLAWLKPRILVTSQLTYNDNLDFTVTDLPGAG